MVDVAKFVQDVSPTKRVYLQDPYSKTLSAIVLKVVEEKNSAYVALDQTIFHPKSGGQPSDRGTIRGSTFQVEVKRAMIFNEVIVHYGKFEGKPDLTSAVCEIDWPNRLLLMRRHTAAHLLDYCLATIGGSRVETTDSWLGDEPYVGYAGPIASSLLPRRIEELANRFIQEGKKVEATTVDRSNAESLIANAPNISRLPKSGKLRVVTIEGQISIPCGGTHVNNTAEIGNFKLHKVEKVSEGNAFRVYFDVK